MLKHANVCYVLLNTALSCFVMRPEDSYAKEVLEALDTVSCFVCFFFGGCSLKCLTPCVIRMETSVLFVILMPVSYMTSSEEINYGYLLNNWAFHDLFIKEKLKYTAMRAIDQ